MTPLERKVKVLNETSDNTKSRAEKELEAELSRLFRQVSATREKRDKAKKAREARECREELARIRALQEHTARTLAFTREDYDNLQVEASERENQLLTIQEQHVARISQLEVELAEARTKLEAVTSALGADAARAVDAPSAA